MAARRTARSRRSSSDAARERTRRELETLEQQAELGKRYLSELRGEVKRLVLVCEQEADGAAIEKLAGKAR